MQCFLSYSREDKARADKLYLHIRQIGVWMDHSPPPYVNKGIPPGVEWDAFIAERIAESEVFLPLFSTEKVDPDRYFSIELLAAFSKHKQGENPKKIIPILLGASRAPRIREEVDFSKFQWIDLDDVGFAQTVRLLAAQVELEQKTQEIEVSHADELLQCLGPNRRIILSAGDYDITALPERVFEFPFIGRESRFDGDQLIINNLDNLTIANAQHAQPHVFVSPRYSFPLMFKNCKHLTIDGLRVGHSPQDGECQGGVVALHGCQNVRLVNTEMYGCGTVGVEIDGGDTLSIDNCIIEKCNTGFATIRGATNVSIRDTVIRDNKVYFGLSLRDADGITISNCTIERNTTSEGFFVQDSSPQAQILESAGSTNIVIEHSTIAANTMRLDLDKEPNIRMRGNRIV